MARDALPCVVCGKELVNVEATAANQPFEGTAFETAGHYGSTIFDPMDGQYLELNVCDECLRRLAGEGKVLITRRYKPVLAPGPVGNGSIVGRAPTPNRPMLPWTPGQEVEDRMTAENVLYVEEGDVGNSELFPEIEWNKGIV